MFRISDLGFRVYQPCDGHPIHCPVHRRGNLFPHVFPEARFLARTFVRSCRWAFVRRKIPFHAAQDFSNAYFMWLPRQAIPSFYSSQRGDQPSAPQMMNQLFQVLVRDTGALGNGGDGHRGIAVIAREFYNRPQRIFGTCRKSHTHLQRDDNSDS